MTETQKFNKAVENWVKDHSFKNFIQLYYDGFRNNPKCFYRIYHIIRNTLSGKYTRIAINNIIRSQELKEENNA